MTQLELSVVVPAFNEEQIIQQTVEAVTAYLAGARMAHEILVVDDGSTDRTVERLRVASRQHPAIRILEAPHRGKGAAVRQGVLATRGAQVLFMDADHSTRIQEWAKCAPWFRGGYDVVIGSRKIPAADVQARQPFLRELMGKGFTWLSNGLLGTRVTDFTCGFKAFRAEAAQRIFARQRITGWGFDAEILFIARQLGLRIKEVPVTWTNDPSTKVRLWRDTLASFAELVRIRLGGWRGYYADKGGGNGTTEGAHHPTPFTFHPSPRAPSGRFDRRS